MSTSIKLNNLDKHIKTNVTFYLKECPCGKMCSSRNLLCTGTHENINKKIGSV